MKNIKAKILAVALLIILLLFLTMETRAANGFYEETTPAVTTEQTEATTEPESTEEETTATTDDIIKEDTTTTPTETETEPVVEETTVPVETKPEEVKPEETKPTEPKPTEKPTEPKPTTPPSDKHSDTKNYIGRFKISSVGVNVACYAGSEQSIVDAKDSAAYFYGFGHIIIGDHKHQGFSAIKSCSVGTKAQMVTKNGTETFTCVGKIQGHNTGYELTDANYVPINDLYPGSIACYTCNDNWKNVTIVFFMPDSEMNKPSQPEEPKEEQPVYGCGEGRHKWTDWKFEWAGSTNGKEFHWESHECMVCHDEEWELIYDYIPEQTPEPSTPVEENKPDETEPEQESTNVTEPSPEPTEPPTEEENNKDTEEPVSEETIVETEETTDEHIGEENN